MNSESVDLIYLDPPFNSKTNYAAPIGSKAAGAAFKDTWTLSDVDAEWINLIEAKHPALYRMLLAAMTSSDKSYLAYMAARLLEMRRVLKPTGSIYLHCDPTMSHYLKIVMDAVFGRRNFRNEIVWKRQSAHSRARRYGPVHDVLLYYFSTDRPTWNRTLQTYDQTYIDSFYRSKDEHGRRYTSDNLTGPGLRTGSSGLPWHAYDPGCQSRHWELPPDRSLPSWFVFPDGYARMTCQERLDILDAQSLIAWPKRGRVPRFKRYLSAMGGIAVQDVITDIVPVQAHGKERVGYPTQKPLALLERIIAASSNAGDVVLDPFCGCATACIAAQAKNREWVGIDISPKAAELVQQRMRDELGMFYQGAHRTDVPLRTDLGKLPRYNSPQNRTRLYGEQGGHCAGCATHFEPRHFDVDHIIARAKGGTDHIENLQLLRIPCNAITCSAAKRSRIPVKPITHRSVDACLYLLSEERERISLAIACTRGVWAVA